MMAASTQGHLLTHAAANEKAIVTPSYAADLDRCRLLCESMDRFVTGFGHHYLVVAGHDVKRFRVLEAAHRTIIDERDLLPGWLRPFRDPTSLFRRHVWLSNRIAPLRGWHVQQLRRIAIARYLREDTMIYCDSDVFFLKPFDCAAFCNGDRTRLYRNDHGISTMALSDHLRWVENSGRALGLPKEQISDHDYITTLISWRRESVLEMIAHIEKVHGRHWLEAVARDRRFSECTLYGRFVDEIAGGAHHFHDGRQFCRVLWTGESLNETELTRFISGMEPYQVAIGIQSFIRTSVDVLRRQLDA